jgi:predicted nucleic acid-binding protein
LITPLEFNLASYEVDFFYSSAEAPETYNQHITHHTVSGVPDYLLGEAAVAHITARLLHDNPGFRRIRNLKILNTGVSPNSGKPTGE